MEKKYPKQQKSDGKTEKITPSSEEYQKSSVESAWKLISLLREETLSTQKIRAQVIGFKITTITLSIGFILEKGVSPVVFIVIAYAAILFDFLITSYSIAIKRSGFYIRTELESKIIRKETNWPKNVLLWEEFMTRQESTQMFSMYGNLGLTSLAFILAGASLFMPINPAQPGMSGMVIISYVMMVGLAVLFYFDFRAHLRPRKMFVHGV